MTREKPLLVDGVLALVSPVLGVVIISVGKLVELVQALVRAQDSRRAYTAEELESLRKVFGDALNYKSIGIIEGRAGLFGLNPRAFTLGNTIYTKQSLVVTDLLVHESVHAWQYQHIGARYAGEAVLAQWLVPDAYNWQREIESRGKNDWTEWNREAQAQFIQDLWYRGELRDESGATVQSGHGAFFNATGESTTGHFRVYGHDFTALAHSAVQTIRAAAHS